jgi:hypothetical protein
LIIPGMNRIILLLIFILIYLLPDVNGQPGLGGSPYSFTNPVPAGDIVTFKLYPPDIQSLKSEDSVLELAGYPYRAGIVIEKDIDMAASGTWVTMPGKGRLCRMAIVTKDARGLVCYFSSFSLPPGSSLFLYNSDSSAILGAFSSHNNADGGNFATGIVPGSTMILEYYEPPGTKNSPDIHISGISYIYKGSYSVQGTDKGFGSSGWCEVNVNCSPEGDSWQDEKRGVARILIKIGTGTYWCSGSLVNNTRQDHSALFLTADHCGQGATSADLGQWVFYFNYEAQGCADPSSEPLANSIVGCQKLASTGGVTGNIVASDFYLLKLSQQVPDNFNPYYNGWTASTAIPQSGAGIHHPAGDIKKISLYTAPAFSTQWGGTPDSHWGVRWVATQNGHGVTEGGSSGSPLFNSQGFIVGTLSGGDASCDNLDQPDLYGKFSYSWDRPGSVPENRLRDWLDPDNTGITELNGTFGNVVHVVADFMTDTTYIPVGSSIDFTDLSFGNPTSWKWYFEGGDPEFSELKNPQDIQYKYTGSFSVMLTASNEETTDSIIKLAYIRVIPRVYPNPTDKKSADNYFNIDFGNRDLDGLELEVYNTLGQQMRFRIGSGGHSGIIRIWLDEHPGGIYLLKVHTDVDDETYKLVLTN